MASQTFYTQRGLTTEGNLAVGDTFIRSTTGNLAISISNVEKIGFTSNILTVNDSLQVNGNINLTGSVTATNISGTSTGTNTGDQTSIVGITGTVAQFNTAITDGDLATGGGTATGTNTGDQTITLTGGVTGSGTGSFAATVVTNANLTGVVTSVGNATSIADAALSIGKTSGLQSALDLKAPLASPTFTGNVTVPTPVNATDATNKSYVDALVTSGSVWKDPVVDPDIQNTVAATGFEAAAFAAMTEGETYTYIASASLTFAGQGGGTSYAAVAGDVVTLLKTGTVGDWSFVDSVNAGDRFIIAGEHGTIGATLYGVGFRKNDLIQYVSGAVNLYASWTKPHDAGYQVINFTAAKAAGSVTTLVNTTVYDLNVSINGTNHNVTATADASYTFGELATSLTSSLNAAYAGASCVLEAEGHFHIYSGDGTKVIIAEGTGANPLLAGLTTDFDLTNIRSNILAGVLDGVTVLVNDPQSKHYGHTYIYTEGINEWTEISGPGAVGAGTGLEYSGNVLNVIMGAGIIQLPTDEVGVDVYSGGGLMTTTNGSASSTLTNAQLSLTQVGTAGTYTSVTTDAHGRVTAGTNPTPALATTATNAINVGVTTVTTGTFYPALVDALTGNVVVNADTNISFDAATNNLSTTTFTGNLTGTASTATTAATAATVTTAAQPAITSVGTLTGLTVTATITGNISGSAATLTTPRAIYGNNFDGSAALTQIIASTYGGTGNGFTAFTGPTTSEKTFTLPNASATLLYDGGALGTPSSGTLTNCTFPTLNQNTTGYAEALKSATTTVNVSAATAPTTGQVLTATSNVSATWQTLSLSANSISQLNSSVTVTDTGTDGTATAVLDGVTVMTLTSGSIAITTPITYDETGTSFGNVATTIDSFAHATYRSAKYVVSVTNGSTYQVAEVLVTHNGTTAYDTSYAVVSSTGTPFITFSSTISGANVLLQATGTASGNTAKVQKIYIAV